jgi:tetratricopeptide (TPR) repeat protein
VAQNNPDEQRARLKRILPEQAIALAMAGRWAEAVKINRALLALVPNDADAYNRLGKALVELGNYREAYDAYQKALELAPGNSIAQKNMERLAPLARQAGAAAQPAARTARTGEGINPHLFIEDTGKTGLTSLVNLAGPVVLRKLTAGDRVELRREGGALRAYSEDGEYIGQVELKLAQRLARFMDAGNRYTAAITAVSDRGVSLIIREVYQDPSMLGRPSFASPGVASAYRGGAGASRYGLDDDEDLDDRDYESDYESETEEAEEEVEFEDEEIEDRE